MAGIQVSQIDDHEEWMSISGLPSYEISSLGRVRSLERTVTQANGKLQPQPARVISTRPGTNGYLCVHIRHGGKRRKIKVHLLVARAFFGVPPVGYECRHKNGNRLDPRKDNLVYGTRKQNIADAIAHGTFGRLRKNRRLESQRGADGKFKIGPSVRVSEPPLIQDQGRH